jgi:hypothetical protein
MDYKKLRFGPIQAGLDKKPHTRELEEERALRGSAGLEALRPFWVLGSASW